MVSFILFTKTNAFILVCRHDNIHKNFKTVLYADISHLYATFKYKFYKNVFFNARLCFLHFYIMFLY